MKNVLCVRLKNWSIDRLRRRLQALAHRPLVLVRTVAGRQLVVAASDEARSAGVGLGLALVEARALCAGLVHAEHDPLRDAQGIDALGRWMQRFTPTVALPKHEPDETPLGDYLFLDITGCERLFGGIDVLTGQVADALREMSIDAKLAVAPTPGAAWALASAQSQVARVDDPDNIAAALAPLPPSALRLDDETSAALHHLGIESIAQLMDLPRQTLPARFGPKLLLRLDQALGRIPEPLVALPQPDPIEAAITFEAAIDSLELIWLALRQLLEQVIAELARRNCGARELVVHFLRDRKTALTKTIRLSRVSRSRVNLFNLLQCALESLQTEEGFTGIRLDVPVIEHLLEEQALLLAQEELADRQALDELFERLRIRMGESALVRPEVVESHIPERAWTPTKRCHPERSEGSMRLSGRDCPLAPFDDPPAPRPLHLLPKPEELRVMVAPSDDHDGRPVQFSHGRSVHALRFAIGPERIAGEWWRGHNRTRDYFEVEDQSGRRFWIFRVGETARWFLHGIRE